MTQRDITIQAVCAILIALCFGASGVLSTGIASEAGRSQLVYADRATEGDPPAVAYGTAMGAFRGLFVNYLWLRATRLKEEGKFHEAIQLSEAITKLQPRFERVWAFHAWNMAYNISVATGTAEERYEWVNAGVELLRDEALVYNPNSVLIHKELSWLYIHKMQGIMDDANRYYKRRLAQEWTEIMGAPPALVDEPDVTKEIYTDWLLKIVEAPNTTDRLIQDERNLILEAMTPDEREANPEPATKIGALIAEIRAQQNVGLDLRLLRIYAYWDAVNNAVFANADVIMERIPTNNTRIVELLMDPTYADAWDRLIPHVRKRVLIDEYRMEPLRMLHYTERYGPLDWRHPATHGIYWASRGVEESLERQNTTETSYVNTDRLIVHCLQELFRSGTIYFDILDSNAYTADYNLHYTDSYGWVLENIIRDRAQTVDNTDRAYSLYSEGYKNFLLEVIRLYYRLGETAIAARYQEDLAGSDWLNTNDPFELEDIGTLSLRDLVNRQLADERFGIPYVARTEITGSIRDGILRGLLRNDPQKFQAAFQYAGLVHERYKKDKVLPTLAEAMSNRMEELPANLTDVAALVYLRLLTTGEVSGPMQASQVYNTAPLGIQVRVYDPIMEYMAGRGMDQASFDGLFPEPAGISIYREQRALEEKIKLESGAEIDASG